MADLKTDRGVLRALLADAIRAHHLFNGRCVACGEKATHQSLHQADVLLGLSGVAVVALPEPGDDDGDGLLWPGISGHPGLYVSTTDPDGLVYDDESSFLPAEALDIAGQWASAAAAAAGVFSEGETND